MTNPPAAPATPVVGTCLRCGRQYNPAAEGDALFCGQCEAALPSVTAILIALNVIMFVAMNVSIVAKYVPGGGSPVDPTAAGLIRWGASYGPLELSTQWWRVFTAMFVHIGLLHVALNMYCLWNLGPLAERLFGPGKFLLLYLLSGLGGNVASVALHPTIVAAGASGAIFGVAGALLPVLHMRDIPAIVSLRSRGGRLGIGGFILYNLIYGFANTGIDNAAHIGGLVVGFIIGYAVPVAGSHTGRAAVLRTQGVLLATALFLGAAFVGVRRWRHTYADLEVGRRAILNGDDAYGIAQLQRVLQSDPNNPQAHLLMGAVYYDQDSMRAAVREFQRALRGDSTDTEKRPRQPLDRAFVLLNLGAAYWRLEQWDSAAAAYTGATRANPSDAEAWEDLGEAYLKNHRAADAVGPLERAAKLAPDTARILFNLGLAYQGTRRYSAALASFQRALRLRPDDPLGLIQRGVVYAQLGKLDSARADFRTVLNKPDGTIDDEIRAEARRLLAALPSGGGRH